MLGRNASVTAAWSSFEATTMKTRVGIRHEDKSFELRTPIVPADVQYLAQQHGLEFVVEPSRQRGFSEANYKEVGAKIGNIRGSDVPVVFALKEIPHTEFEPGKVYLFFAHVIKGQPQNMGMLRRLMDVGATLVDYERIVEVPSGKRLIFFGNWAGYAGMAEALRALGLKLTAEGVKPNPFAKLRPTFQYDGLKGLEEAIRDVGESIRKDGLPPVLTPCVVGIIGYGNTSKGAQAILDLLPHKEVTPAELPTLAPDSHVVYKVVFHEEDTVHPRNPRQAFDLQDYFANGSAKYEAQFSRHLPYLTVIMNCIYWSTKQPRMVTRSDTRELWKRTQAKPRLRVIGDISCDIDGAIEFTTQATKPDQPFFTYDPVSGKTSLGVAKQGIVVMAVDNLPTELPRESSTSFSKTLSQFVPAIAKADYTVPFEKLALPPEIKKAVIVYRGKLTPEYKYLEEYLAKQK
jgi:saccharopine dehydrogenase (NAD+, L-lysine-forming)